MKKIFAKSIKKESYKIKKGQNNRFYSALFFGALGIGIFLFIGIAFVYYYRTFSLSESRAISLIQATRPEFENYPNDQLPPQSIQTQRGMNGWYVAFVQEGSGRPILGVTCFFVKDDGTIRLIGEFIPGFNHYNFSLKTCK